SSYSNQECVCQCVSMIVSPDGSSSSIHGGSGGYSPCSSTEWSLPKNTSCNGISFIGLFAPKKCECRLSRATFLSVSEWIPSHGSIPCPMSWTPMTSPSWRESS